jgi:cell division protein FtsZ
MITLSVPQVDQELRPRITVFGVGGAGGNAVNNMIRSNLEGVEFVVANTDAQAIKGSLAERRIQLGTSITRGLGAGSRPDVGRAAAEEQLEEIMGCLDGANMVFITAGMGGGTGTGAAPVIARTAREQGILTVGVVTKPFHFEGAHRMRLAEAGIQELQQFVDTLIIIPNQNLFRIANERTTFADAFKMADDVLHSGVRGVTDLMIMPGLINLDFADIRAVMSEMGKAMMGTGEATGERRAIDAAEAAISNPLLDDVSMKGAKGVLINITGGLDMTLFEVDEAANRIRDEVDPDANIIFGSTFDDSLEGKMRVSVVATGIDAAQASRPVPVQPFSVVAGGRGIPGIPGVPAVPVRQAATIGGGTPAHGTARAAEPSIATALHTASPAVPTGQMTMGQAAERFVEADTAPQMQQPVPHVAEPPRPPMLFPQETGIRVPAAPAPQPALRGASVGGAFIAPKPAEGAPRAATEAEPGRHRDSLFKRMTAGARSVFGTPDAPAVAQPARAGTTQGSTPSAQPSQSFGGPAPAMTQARVETRTPSAGDDEMLDIPAFLRRQAN